MKHIKKDIFSLFKTFQRDVIEANPPLKKMEQEVRWMQFKIRPLFGNIDKVDFQNEEFIKILWRLGKLDEFYSQHKPLIKKQDRKMFFQIFNGMYKQYQLQLRNLDMTKNQSTDSFNDCFELEIYKERSLRFN